MKHRKLFNHDLFSSGIRRLKYILSLLLAFILGLILMWLIAFKPGLSSQHQSNLSQQDIKKIQETYQTIQEKYLQEIPHDKILDGALSGMVKATDDPFSSYLTKSEKEALQESMESSFEGIGAQIASEDGRIKIISPIKDSPADKVGLKPNDYIIKADGKDLTGLSADEAVKIIRGKAGTELELEILRNGKEQKVSLKRAKVPITTVHTEILDDHQHIGYLQITEFSEPTYDEVVKALKNFQKQNVQKIVLDLRNNPGGLLPSVLQIANIFLEDDDTIAKVEEKSGQQEIMKANAKQLGSYRTDMPLTILVNEGSASASEILAGALQDNQRAQLVGEKTFGKGTVQTVFEVDDSSELKLTVAKWLTPKGTWIHEKGIEPDQKVKLPSYAELTLIDLSKTYQLNDEGDEILNIQKMLSALDYLPDEEVNSQFNDKMLKAIQSFEKDKALALSQDKLNRETEVALVQAIQNKIKENDTQLAEAKKISAEQ